MNKIIKMKGITFVLLMFSVACLTMCLDEFSNVVKDKSVINDYLGTILFGVIGLGGWFYTWLRITKESKDENKTG